jgi:transcription initiation factor TFIIB
MAQLRVADVPCRACQVQGLGETKTVLDHTTGDLICTSCGLVLQERCIDEGQEWRNFVTDGVEFGMKTNGRMRGGDTSNNSITGELQGTSFSGGGAKFESFQKLQQMADSQMSTLSASEKSLKNVVAKVRVVTTTLNLSESILERCVTFLTHLSEKNTLGARHDAPWFYAIVYLACREEGASRNMHELAYAGASEREVSEDGFLKNMKKKVKNLERKDVLGSQLRMAKNQYIDPQELMARFVSRLQLSEVVCNPSVHIVKEARRCNLLKDRSGIGSDEQTHQCAVIASAIFIVAHLLDFPEKPRLQDVAAIARVSEASVMSAYEGLKPHTGMLLPEAFKRQTEANIAKLPPARPPKNRLPELPAAKRAKLDA